MKRWKIAAVDDNEDILYTITEICRASEIEVAACRDYHEAQRALNRGDIDLFLVDFHMPEKDGTEVVRMIRRVNRTVPIVMLTIEDSPEVVRRVKEAGANDFAVKPIRAIDLLSRIESHLKYHSQAQFYTDRTAGINAATLEKLVKQMEQYETAVEIETIAGDCKISVKSVYRYVRYMTEEGLLQAEYVYQGNKKGRPRTLYRLLRKGS
ncbi:MAG: response regulator [Lachnospiraceae bacterium]|jgi:two-component system response regulator DctR|nr:response regulator [Lachnospiraceae bacterium]